MPKQPKSPQQTPVKQEHDESDARRCNYCGVTSTPMWRHGPGEYVHLCNSCGVKWRRGKILQNTKHRHHLCKKGASRSPAPLETKQTLATSTIDPLTCLPSPGASPTRAFGQIGQMNDSGSSTIKIKSVGKVNKSQGNYVHFADIKMETADKENTLENDPVTEFANLVRRVPQSRVQDLCQILQKCRSSAQNSQLNVQNLNKETWTALQSLCN